MGLRHCLSSGVGCFLGPVLGLVISLVVSTCLGHCSTFCLGPALDFFSSSRTGSVLIFVLNRI